MVSPEKTEQDRGAQSEQIERFVAVEHGGHGSNSFDIESNREQGGSNKAMNAFRTLFGLTSDDLNQLSLDKAHRMVEALNNPEVQAELLEVYRHMLEVEGKKNYLRQRIDF